jgi:hypothetical protein
MCAPTLSDITRSWGILEHFKNNWIESVWLGCTLERYEEIRSYDDFMKWLDEKPEHANSDLGMFWRMGTECGLDKFGHGVGRYVTWGHPGNRMRCLECMYYYNHRKWCAWPEIDLPPEPEWWCRLWRI